MSIITEAIASRVIKNILGEYLQGFRSDQLKINFQNFQASLRNAKLRMDALYSLHLPFEIENGEAQTVDITVRSLNPLRVKMTINGVSGECSPQVSFISNKESEELPQQVNLNQQNQQNKQQSSSGFFGSGLFQSLTNSIANSNTSTNTNNQQTQNITVNVTGGIGKNANEMKFDSKKQYMKKKEQLIEEYEQREINDLLKGMDIYVNDVTFTYHQKNDFVIHIEKVVIQEGNCTLTNIQMKHVEKEKENDEGKKVMEIPTATIDFEKKSFHFPKVEMQMSKECYNDCLELFNHFMKYSRQIEYSEMRPTTPVGQDPKKWWKYASQIVQLQLMDNVYRKELVDKIKHKYVSFRVDILMGRHLKQENQSAVDIIEERLTPLELAYLRKIAIMKFNKEEELNNKTSSFFDAFRNRIVLTQQQTDELFQAVDIDQFMKKRRYGKFSIVIDNCSCLFEGIGRFKFDTFTAEGDRQDDSMHVNATIKNCMFGSSGSLNEITFTVKYDKENQHNGECKIKSKSLQLNLSTEKLKHIIEFCKFDFSIVKNIAESLITSGNSLFQISTLIKKNGKDDQNQPNGDKQLPTFPLMIESDKVTINIRGKQKDMKISVPPITMNNAFNTSNIPIEFDVQFGNEELVHIKSILQCILSEKNDSSLMKMKYKIKPTDLTVSVEVVNNLIKFIEEIVDFQKLSEKYWKHINKNSSQGTNSQENTIEGSGTNPFGDDDINELNDTNPFGNDLNSSHQTSINEIQSVSIPTLENNQQKDIKMIEEYELSYQQFDKSKLHRCSDISLIVAGKKMIEFSLEIEKLELNILTCDNITPLLRLDIRLINWNIESFTHYVASQFSIYSITGVYNETTIVRSSKNFLQSSFIISNDHTLKDGLNWKMNFGDITFNLTPSFISKTIELIISFMSLNYPNVVKPPKETKIQTVFMGDFNFSSLTIQLDSLVFQLITMSIHIGYDGFFDSTFYIQSMLFNDYFSSPEDALVNASLKQTDKVTFISLIINPFVLTLKPSFFTALHDILSNPELWNIDVTPLLDKIHQLQRKTTEKSSPILVETNIYKPTLIFEIEDTFIFTLNQITITPYFINNSVIHHFTFNNPKIKTNRSQLLSMEYLKMMIQDGDKFDLKTASVYLTLDVRDIEFFTKFVTSFINHLGIGKISILTERIMNLYQKIQMLFPHTHYVEEKFVQFESSHVEIIWKERQPILQFLLNNFKIQSFQNFILTLERCTINDLMSQNDAFNTIIETTKVPFLTIKQISNERVVEFKDSNIIIHPESFIQMMKGVMNFINSIPHKDVQTIVKTIKMKIKEIKQEEITTDTIDELLQNDMNGMNQTNDDSENEEDQLFGMTTEQVTFDEINDNSEKTFTIKEIMSIIINKIDNKTFMLKQTENGVYIECNNVTIQTILNQLRFQLHLSVAQCTYIMNCLIRENILQCENKLVYKRNMYSIRYTEEEHTDKIITVPILKDFPEQPISYLSNYIKFASVISFINERTPSTPFVSMKIKLGASCSEGLRLTSPISFYSGTAKESKIKLEDAYVLSKESFISCDLINLLKGSITFQLGELSLTKDDLKLITTFIEEMKGLSTVCTIKSLLKKQYQIPLSLDIALPNSTINLSHPSKCFPLFKIEIGSDIQIRGNPMQMLVDCKLRSEINLFNYQKNQYENALESNEIIVNSFINNGSPQLHIYRNYDYSTNEKQPSPSVTPSLLSFASALTSLNNNNNNNKPKQSESFSSMFTYKTQLLEEILNYREVLKQTTYTMKDVIIELINTSSQTILVSIEGDVYNLYPFKTQQIKLSHERFSQHVETAKITIGKDSSFVKLNNVLPQAIASSLCVMINSNDDSVKIMTFISAQSALYNDTTFSITSGKLIIEPYHYGSVEHESIITEFGEFNMKKLKLKDSYLVLTHDQNNPFVQVISAMNYINNLPYDLIVRSGHYTKTIPSQSTVSIPFCKSGSFYIKAPTSSEVQIKMKGDLADEEVVLQCLDGIICFNVVKTQTSASFNCTVVTHSLPFPLYFFYMVKKGKQPIFGSEKGIEQDIELPFFRKCCVTSSPSSNVLYKIPSSYLCLQSGIIYYPLTSYVRNNKTIIDYYMVITNDLDYDVYFLCSKCICCIPSHQTKPLIFDQFIQDEPKLLFSVKEQTHFIEINATTTFMQIPFARDFNHSPVVQFNWNENKLTITEGYSSLYYITNMTSSKVGWWWKIDGLSKLVTVVPYSTVAVFQPYVSMISTVDISCSKLEGAMLEVEFYHSKPMINGQCEVSINHFKVHGQIVNEIVISLLEE